MQFVYPKLKKVVEAETIEEANAIAFAKDDAETKPKKSLNNNK